MLFSLVTSQFVSILSFFFQSGGIGNGEHWCRFLPLHRSLFRFSPSFFQSGGIGNSECWCRFLPLHRSLFRFSPSFFKVEELETVSAGAVFSRYIAVCFDSLFFFQSGGIGNGECWCCFLSLHRGLFRFSLLLLFKVEELEMVSAGAVFSRYIAFWGDSLFFFSKWRNWKQ